MLHNRPETARLQATSLIAPIRGASSFQACDMAAPFSAALVFLKHTDSTDRLPL